MNKNSKNKILILVGIKHSGKSSVGKLLAEKLNCTFIDIDDVIEEFCEGSCRTLYREKGPEAFYAAELEACGEVVRVLKHDFLLKNNTLVESCAAVRAVVSTGGGICNNVSALDILKECGGTVLYLNVREDLACNRIIASSIKRGSYPPYIVKALQPLKPEDYTEKAIREVFHSFYKDRTRKYERVADVQVCVDNAPKQKNVERVLQVL